MGTFRFSRISTYSLQDKLKSEGINISATSVGNIMKYGNFSLLRNRKSIAETKHPDRNEQFEIIASERKLFNAKCQPIICVDSKKKELIGNFKNPGNRWSKEAEKVYNHEFMSAALGIAKPYGIYEVQFNLGTVIIGTSKDTPEFAVDSINTWLEKYAVKRYRKMNELLILCDSGGSNGCRPRLWKYLLFHKICKKHSIRVKVCHYPAGASKWNMVDHRLFSHITKNWQGIPLRSYETIINCIRNTKTKKGLKVEAEINNKKYDTGIKISDSQMKEINIINHKRLTNWNYTICP